MRTVQRLVCLVPWIVLAACGDTGSNKPSLTKVAGSTGDAMCANGGVIITSGVDKNDNGVLDDDEVTSTNEVCNGTSTTGMTGTMGTTGVAALFTTTDLPFGEANCSGGGLRIDSGLDNGAGGGTAGDGILQTGEITSTKYVCNGSLPTFPGSFTPPESPAGAFKINTSGATGTAGKGGNGGHVDLYFDQGSSGGHVKIWKTGVADASSVMPTEPAFVAGATPLVVNADLTIHNYATITLGNASGDAFFLTSNASILYAKGAAAVATPVTSVNVAAGKTLTFEPNYTSYTLFYTSGDIKNAGTLTTTKLQPGNITPADLYLYPSSFYGEAGSSVNLVGANNAGGVGGNGGSWYVQATGHTYNQGTVNTSGGNGDTGGTAGYIYFYADPGDTYNSGALTAKGGTGAVNNGGDGPTGSGVYIYSGYKNVFNSGAIDASGGTGATAGGTAGFVQIYAQNRGACRNAGAITAKGGTCTGTNCDGGSGNTGNGVYLYAYSGVLVSSGAIDTSGAAGAGTGNGGNAGYIGFYNGEGTSYSGGPDLPTGDIRVSGNLTTKGGSGASGGYGGYIYAELNPYYNPQGQEIAFFGYTDITTAGGNATGGNGGNGGHLSLSNEYSYLHGGNDYGPGGAAINYANFVGNGGNGNRGGNGGYFYASTQTSYTFTNTFEVAQNFGALDTHGGNSSAAGQQGGRGARVRMTGIAGVENHGNVVANGGSATGTTANGGGVQNNCYLHADYGPATNSGTWNLSGGNATDGSGADGGSFELYGLSVTSSAALTSNGGNGGGAGSGGGGGSINLNASPTGPSKITGTTFSVSGGTGTPAGTKGVVTIDGADATP